jgi:hypothetical protein
LRIAGQRPVHLRDEADQCGRGRLHPGHRGREFLGALGVGALQLPPTLDGQAALYRTLLADRRMLILLDNARDADHVRPLLPGSPGCLVLVTSGDELPGLAVGSGAELVKVEPLGTADATLMPSAYPTMAIQFVDVRHAFTNHEVCTIPGGGQWINGYALSNVDASFHPNEEGQRQYAGLINAALL